MQQRKIRYKDTYLTEDQLTKRLLTHIIGIVLITVLVVVSLVFFAPKVGSFFGLFSKHRKDPLYMPKVVLAAPIFEEVPNSVKEPKITLKGRAEAGTTIKLYVNGPEKATTTAGTDGVFEFSEVILKSKNNTIFGRAFMENGNESEASETYNVVVDDDRPKLTIEFPKDGDVIRNLNKRVMIKGKVDEKATITINGNTAIQKPDFSFEYLLGVNEGDNEIKIEAVDEAGNKVEETLKIKYEKLSG